FFQAEDGIRDFHVTGVQTCALPIYRGVYGDDERNNCRSWRKGPDIIVHSTIHPIMGPDKGSGMPPLIYYRQSNTSDLGAMAKREIGRASCRERVKTAEESRS